MKNHVAFIVSNVGVMICVEIIKKALTFFDGFFSGMSLLCFNVI